MLPEYFIPPCPHYSVSCTIEGLLGTLIFLPTSLFSPTAFFNLFLSHLSSYVLFQLFLFAVLYQSTISTNFTFIFINQDIFAVLCELFSSFGFATELKSETKVLTSSFRMCFMHTLSAHQSSETFATRSPFDVMVFK